MKNQQIEGHRIKAQQIEAQRRSPELGLRVLLPHRRFLFDRNDHYGVGKLPILNSAAEK